jgi:hypothetical protein
LNVTSDIQNKGCGVAQNKVRRSSDASSEQLQRSGLGLNDCDFYVIICNRMSQSIEIQIN